MAKLVTLIIDGKTVTVPPGTMVVDAAKKIGIDIPIFCYHPKMEPVGMCRMCLVEIGRPVIDRATNQLVLDAEGKPRIQFGPKLDTACTTPVSEGMVVLTTTPKVGEARKEVLEFLLTSHPLDCPVCDKGGECPLQNLTLAYGPGQSRFLYDEKMHLAKHIPLGELIYLDRERCIQCARCVRFQHEVVDDPVLGLSQRGRSLEIITSSQPGFDSIFSGNTTDICPVGALTTADFRFAARPWELKSSASICNHCPVGCNIVYDIRREAKAGGKTAIKRVMPRQNEAVNEIWMCDKGRFAYHYTESDMRLAQPMVREGSNLVPATWDEALNKIAAQLSRSMDNPNPSQGNPAGLVTLVGGRLANEDLFNLREFTQALGGQVLLYGSMGGGEWVAQYGVAPGTNFGEVGKGTAILVIASDLHEEAPLWWLRIKQAARRGARLIVVNPRPTRLDVHASHVVRYAYGEEVDTLGYFLPENADQIPEMLKPVVEAFQEAEDALIVFGSEGLGVRGSTELAQVSAQVLAATHHTGRPNNGLVGVWPNGNTQGAFELGFCPMVVEEMATEISRSNITLIAGADLAGDSPALARALDQAGFVVVQELFLTETARRADVVLPVQAYTEREGTYTSGERRVQRFYPVLPVRTGPLPDFAITARLAQRLGINLEGRSASLVFQRIAQAIPSFSGLTYAQLAESPEQWPIMGKSDLYYGGTGYENKQGVGVRLALQEVFSPFPPGARREARANGDEMDGLWLLPFSRLYDRGQLILHSPLLRKRLAKTALWLNPKTAAGFCLVNGVITHLKLQDVDYAVEVCLDDDIPQGVALLPRSVGLPIVEPVTVRLERT